MSVTEVDASGAELESIGLAPPEDPRDLALTKISLTRCKMLPSLDGLPVSLVELEADGSGIHRLGANFHLLRNLRVAVLTRSDDLHLVLQDKFPPNLETLVLSRCKKLGSLGHSLEDCRKLTTLTVVNCERLEDLGTLPPTLRVLNATDTLVHAEALETALGGCPGLTDLQVKQCPKLRSLRCLPPGTVRVRASHSGLQHLDIDVNCRALTLLDVSFCAELESLDGVPPRSLLKTLKVSRAHTRALVLCFRVVSGFQRDGEREQKKRQPRVMGR